MLVDFFINSKACDEISITTILFSEISSMSLKIGSPIFPKRYASFPWSLKTL